jgi:hypothetical protein
MSAIQIWDAMDRAIQTPSTRAPEFGLRSGTGLPQYLRFGALLGGMLWLVLLAVPLDGGDMAGEVSRLLLLAILVMLPLGLSLWVEAPWDGRPWDGGLRGETPLGESVLSAFSRHSPRLRLSPIFGLLLPAAAWLAAAALVWPVGRAAGLLATPWLLAATWIAVAEWTQGFRRLRSVRGLGDLGVREKVLFEIASAAAMAFWWVGAGWFLLGRAGIDLGYGPLVARLTAVHFHVAGFAASTLALLTASALMGQRRTERQRVTGRERGHAGQADLGSQPGAHLGVVRKARAEAGAVTRMACGLALLAVPLGMPMVAAGITLGSQSELARGMEVGGSAILAAGLLALAALQALFIAPRMRSRWAGRLLWISSLSLLVSMPLALGYGLRLAGLGIPQMLTWHGRLNALGFALCGLAGWGLDTTSHPFRFSPSASSHP